MKFLALFIAYALAANQYSYGAGYEEPDCEMYLTGPECVGKMHEGKLCYWEPDYESGEHKCNQAENGDIEYLCAQETVPAVCNGVVGPDLTTCYWDATHEVCVGSNSTPDCEFWSASTCNDKVHESDRCYWSTLKGQCEEMEISDMGTWCTEHELNATSCAEAGCFYDFKETKCTDEFSGFLRKERTSDTSENNVHPWQIIMVAMFATTFGVFVGFCLSSQCGQKSDDNYVNMQEVLTEQHA